MTTDDTSFFAGNYFYAYMQWGGIYCAITVQILKMLCKNDQNSQGLLHV